MFHNFAIRGAEVSNAPCKIHSHVNLPVGIGEFVDDLHEGFLPSKGGVHSRLTAAKLLIAAQPGHMTSREPHLPWASLVPLVLNRRTGLRRLTRLTAAGITDHVWDISELLA